ncbi:hypothetical protein [Okeania sp. KiyG1]|uniref:hypothetical protein n=1 Tax=Okeania sp. KiyG1 TaxID=2720165 RepID=UPI00192101F8|nr:hypothetical protein [Okeania sp. KiyG1]GGA02918.1 hypothetical protein CYANOKiyG1_15020 [Okeania sp. KiyG1]
MLNTSNFQFTIDFRDSNNLRDSNNPDDEELLEVFTRNLLRQMRNNLEEVEVTRVPVSKLPEGAKGDEQEPGILNVEINLANIKTFITFLWERLSGKATEVEVKIDKKASIKVKVGSQKDLSAAIQDVEKLVKSISEINNG